MANDFFFWTEREAQEFYDRSRQKRDEKYFIREIQDGINLYRDSVSGLAWILDINTGETEISIHHNHIAKGRGILAKDAPVVHCIDRVFYIDTLITTLDEVYNVLFDECNCAACQERRSRKEG